jgi:hypothetical protein
MTDENNEGFRVLDDFVCDAIPGVGVPRADGTKAGGDEGFPAVQDHSVDAGKKSSEKDSQALTPANKGK